jgi:hypothetical protein
MGEIFLNALNSTFQEDHVAAPFHFGKHSSGIHGCPSAGPRTTLCKEPVCETSGNGDMICPVAQQLPSDNTHCRY